MRNFTTITILLGVIGAPAWGHDAPQVQLNPVSATGAFNNLSDPNNVKIAVGNQLLVEINLDGTTYPADGVASVDLIPKIIANSGSGLNCVSFDIDEGRSDLAVNDCGICLARCGPPIEGYLLPFEGVKYVDFLGYLAELTLECKAEGTFTLQFGSASLDTEVVIRGLPQPMNIIDDPDHFESISIECFQPTCGNGTVESGFGEECDDANSVENDACGNDCLINACGDGALNQALEACDDGNFNNNDDCKNNCTIASCGDGIIHEDQSGTEECDDGGNADGDGCDSNCMFEGNIPAVSEWGMLALSALLLSALVIRSLRPPSSEHHGHPE